MCASGPRIERFQKLFRIDKEKKGLWSVDRSIIFLVKFIENILLRENKKDFMKIEIEKDFKRIYVRPQVIYEIVESLSGIKYLSGNFSKIINDIATRLILVELARQADDKMSILPLSPVSVRKITRMFSDVIFIVTLPKDTVKLLENKLLLRQYIVAKYFYNNIIARKLYDIIYENCYNKLTISYVELDRALYDSLRELYKETADMLTKTAEDELLRLLIRERRKGIERTLNELKDTNRQSATTPSEYILKAFSKISHQFEGVEVKNEYVNLTRNALERIKILAMNASAALIDTLNIKQIEINDNTLLDYLYRAYIEVVRRKYAKRILEGPFVCLSEVYDQMKSLGYSVPRASVFIELIRHAALKNPDITLTWILQGPEYDLNRYYIRLNEVLIRRLIRTHNI
ncbi:MAG: hypothetical protein GXO23_01470 [Crenarchaeota archaeon]|nr:hypothetical protein [Thermoproteota archaeon]